MPFYDLEGNVLKDTCAFINLYEPCYFLSEQPPYVKGIRKSSCLAETEIGNILDRGIVSEEDVFRILAWKLGKINHAATEREKHIVYVKGWAENPDGTFSAKVYNKQLDVKGIAERVISLQACAASDRQGFLNGLNELNAKGIGPVYMLTLLYFASRGAFPIYDRYADMALRAYLNDHKPCNSKAGKVKLGYKELPDRHSSGFASLMDVQMEKYTDNIKNALNGRAYDRAFDRALWVYGHCFLQ